MQVENDYDKEVYNGDIGYIDEVDPEVGEVRASFDGRSVTYGLGQLDTLVPAYAATIHPAPKGRGAKLRSHLPSLRRNPRPIPARRMRRIPQKRRIRVDPKAGRSRRENRAVVRAL